MSGHILDMLTKAYVDHVAQEPPKDAGQHPSLTGGAWSDGVRYGLMVARQIVSGDDEAQP